MRGDITMNLKTLPCFLLLFIPLSAIAEPPATPQPQGTLKRQADAWDAAIVNKDRRAIAANMADSFMQIDSDGATADKMQFIADIVSEDLQISPYKVEDFKIRMYGQTAVLTGKTKMHGTYKNAAFTSHYRFTDVYVNQNGMWKVVNVQTTRIK